MFRINKSLKGRTRIELDMPHLDSGCRAHVLRNQPHTATVVVYVERGPAARTDKQFAQAVERLLGRVLEQEGAYAK